MLIERRVTFEIHGILDEEIARLGDPRRVAIGGNSQGGTVALHAALSHPRGLELACVVCGSTVLLRETELVAPVPADPSPVFVFSAERDAEYLPALQRLAFGRLARAGVRVTSHVEPGLDHYSESVAELHHLSAWLLLALFHEPRREVTYRDRPQTPSAKFSSIFQATLPSWWWMALQHGHQQPARLHRDEWAGMPPEWQAVLFDRDAAAS